MRYPTLFLALLTLLSATGCTSASRHDGDGQTRFEQQQRAYPDRLDSEQEAAHDEQQRQQERLKK